MTNFQWIVVAFLTVITAFLGAILDKLSKLQDQIILNNLTEIPHLLQSIGNGLYTQNHIRPPRDPNMLLDEEEIEKIVEWPFKASL